MDNIGAEVGQKMRSAIKAKLLELNCYVDEELPDYIMVMVANKRSKSQMNEDLTLFLSNKTSTFVDWLHIVLKKLKEVTVTNPEVYKKVVKKKSPNSKVKKEKKTKNILYNIKCEEDSKSSLTDDLPINPHLMDKRRSILMTDGNSFDIPLLSEVQNSSQADLDEIEKKIRSVKSRLGRLVESENEEEEVETEIDTIVKEEQTTLSTDRVVEIQSEDGEKSNYNQESEFIKDTPSADSLADNVTTDTPVISQKRKHTPITFEAENPPKKKSVLERLGKKSADSKQNRISLSEFRKEEEKFLRYSKEHDKHSERNNKTRRERSQSPSEEPVKRSRRETKSILNRLGVMSKVHIPQKDSPSLEPEEELKPREVRSVVQVKPRTIPADAPQPNKNLLLKAMAEAHRSIAQAAKKNVAKLNDSPREPVERKNLLSRKLSQKEKGKLRNLLLAQVSQEKDEEFEDVYVPRPLHLPPEETPTYVPSLSRQQTEEDLNSEEKPFHATVDDIEKTQIYDDLKTDDQEKSPVQRKSVKERLQRRRSPSPIIFDKVTTKITGKMNIPDKLPNVRPPLSIKNKERCKYWPNCRQGDKCEFVHPSTNCEMFPNCKFGDRCLFLHPSCKFSTSCTKRDCPYSHSSNSKATMKAITNKIVTPQICKFFPNCANVNCSYYHPKACKYGKYCKNQAECTFSHQFNVNKTSLTWRSK